MCNQKIVSFLNPLSRGYTECQDSHTTGPINKFLATKKTSCCAARARICLFVYGKSRVQFCPFAGNKTRAAQYTLTSKLLAVLVKYRPVEESTMCTTIMGPVMRESSGRASVETMCTLWHGKREKHTKQRIVDDSRSTRVPFTLFSLDKPDVETLDRAARFSAADICLYFAL